MSCWWVLRIAWMRPWVNGSRVARPRPSAQPLMTRDEMDVRYGYGGWLAARRFPITVYHSVFLWDCAEAQTH
eukprot:4987086-Amphidinium_carterae.1